MENENNSSLQSLIEMYEYYNHQAIIRIENGKIQGVDRERCTLNI